MATENGDYARCSTCVEDDEDFSTITDMDVFDFAFFLFVCDGLKYHFPCNWNCDTNVMKIYLPETSNEMESSYMYAIQQTKTAFKTRFRESYDVTDSELPMAKEFLYDEDIARQYPEIRVDSAVTGTEPGKFVIMSTAENDDKFRTVKHLFELKIGRIKVTKRSISERRELSARPKTSGIDIKRWKFLTFEKINVSIVNDKLENIDGQVDGIINPTNETLEATGQVSKILERLGGEEYIQNCKEAMRSVRRKSNVLVTSGGYMKTKTILHVKCPRMQDKKEHEMQTAVFHSVFSCLEMAAEKSMESVAIPFLYTGNAKIPVCKCGVQYAFAVMEFSRKRTNTFVVQNVVFVDVDEKKTGELVHIFGDVLPDSVHKVLEIPKHIDNELGKSDGDTGSNGFSSSGATGGSVDADEEKLKSDTIDIVVLQGDIRKLPVDAIVCPELQGEPYGGLLSVSIKCAYRNSFSSLSQMSKKVKRIVTLSCQGAETSSTNVKYIFQVHIPLYKVERDTSKLKESINTVFKELKNKPAIKSIAFPLLGVADVQDKDCVQACSKILVEAIFENWSKYEKNISPLQIVLVNRCSIISELLRSHVQALSGERVETGV